jgi:hypothetical protein
MSSLPTFSIPGRSKFFGLYRPTLHSNTIQRGCIVFFPKTDHITLHFANELSGSFKTAAILGKNQDAIYIFVTCDSLEEFDQKTNSIPGNVHIYADVKGAVADQFGIRPLSAVINVKDMFSDSNKRKYEKQTLNGVFFVSNGKIVKSPGFQPKLQLSTVGVIKNVFEYFEKVKEDINLIVSKGSVCEDMTEKDIQTLQKPAWDLYQEEYNQMLEDSGQKVFKPKVVPKKDPDEIIKKIPSTPPDVKKPIKKPIKKTVTPGQVTPPRTTVKKQPLIKKKVKKDPIIQSKL